MTTLHKWQDYDGCAHTIERSELLHAARRVWQTDEVQIDHDARVSDGCEGGLWVQAWVWLRTDDLKGI